MRTYMADVAQNVARFGVHLQGVFGTEGSGPPFVYTVGLAERGHPEVIVFSLEMNGAAVLLNSLAADVLERGRVLVDGEVDDDLALMATTFRAVHPSQVPEYFGIGRRRLRELGITSELSAMQLVWPDPQGRFPWDGVSLRYQRAQPELWHPRITGGAAA